MPAVLLSQIVAEGGKTPESCRRVALKTSPTVFPAIQASFGVVRQLSQSCPTFAQTVVPGADTRPILADLGRVLAQCIQHRAKRVQHWPIWAQVEPTWHEIAQIEPKSLKLGRIWSDVCRPTLTKVRPALAGLRPTRPHCDRLGPKLGRCLSLGASVQLPDNFGAPRISGDNSVPGLGTAPSLAAQYR